MAGDKCIVYILRSCSDPSRYYTGITSDLIARLAAHNAGHCRHTASGRPWEVDVIIKFKDERRALTFALPEVWVRRRLRATTLQRVGIDVLRLGQTEGGEPDPLET